MVLREHVNWPNLYKLAAGPLRGGGGVEWNPPTKLRKTHFCHVVTYVGGGGGESSMYVVHVKLEL